MGKRLGLSPFQSEIRRRLWWHIISRDSRSGEEYGLELANSRLLDSDVDHARQYPRYRHESRHGASSYASARLDPNVILSDSHRTGEDDAEDRRGSIFILSNEPPKRGCQTTDHSGY